MPVETVLLEHSTNRSKTIQFAEAGDIITLNHNFVMEVYLRQGLNAGTLQRIDRQDDFSNAYVVRDHWFIVAQAGHCLSLHADSDHSPWDKTYPLLLLPLKGGEMIDKDGPLVLMRQHGLDRANIAGLIQTWRNYTRPPVSLKYSKAVVAQRADLLEQLKPNGTESLFMDTVSHFIEGLEISARHESHMAQIRVKEKIIPLLTGQLRQAASELVKAQQMTRDIREQLSLLDFFIINDMTKAERKTPLLPRAIAAAPK